MPRANSQAIVSAEPKPPAFKLITPTPAAPITVNAQPRPYAQQRSATTLAVWQARVQRYLDSGMSANAFAQLEGINPDTLRNYRSCYFSHLKRAIPVCPSLTRPIHEELAGHRPAPALGPQTMTLTGGNLDVVLPQSATVKVHQG